MICAINNYCLQQFFSRWFLNIKARQYDYLLKSRKLILTSSARILCFRGMTLHSVSLLLISSVNLS